MQFEKGGRDTEGGTELLTRAAPGPVKAHDPVDALFRVHEQLSPPQLGPTLGSRQARANRGPRPLPAVRSDGHGLHLPCHSLGEAMVTLEAAAAEPMTSGPAAGARAPLTADPPPGAGLETAD